LSLEISLVIITLNNVINTNITHYEKCDKISKCVNVKYSINATNLLNVVSSMCMASDTFTN